MPNFRTILWSFSPSIDDADEGIAGDEEAGEAAAVAGGAEVQKKKEEVDDADLELHCRVMEQKKTVEGLKDEECGRIVEKGHAGLCRYVVLLWHCEVTTLYQKKGYNDLLAAMLSIVQSQFS